MATEAHEAAGAAHATGMPQLDITTWANQIFWLVVALVVIFLVLWRVALPRIGAVLAERRGTITNDLAAAEELKQKAVAAEKAYNDALAAARIEAGRIVAKAKADIQVDLDAAIAKADAEIAAKTAESEKALAEIRAGAEQAVTAVALETADAVVSAMGGQADAAAVKAAVTNALKG